MILTKWKVVYPLPRCCRCGCDALSCLVLQSRDKKAVKQNAAAMKRWKARTKAAERMLTGASLVEKR